MKKILVAVISIALTVFLSFGAYADIIQPNATQFELGYSISSAPTTITDIVQFSSLPYTYNAQLMMNGNNNALYTYGLYNISGFTDSDQVATSYDFVGGQSYEVTYRFSMQFADNNLASYLEYIDPQLIGINAYFTNDPLASFTNGMPSSTIASYSSNYSAAITNETVVSSHDPNIAGTVSFDVVLLFKLNLNYSGSFHKILLNLDFHNFATAIPSGNSGFFYCQLTYQSITNYTSLSWNTLPTTLSGYSYYRSSDDYLYKRSATSLAVVCSQGDVFSYTFTISNNFSYSQYFLPGYSYRGYHYVEINRSISNGVISSDVDFSGFGLCATYDNLGSSPASPITDCSSFPDYSFVVTVASDNFTSSQRKTVYKLEYSFTVPTSFEYFYRCLAFTLDIDTPNSTPQTVIGYPSSFGYIHNEFDPSGSLLTPDEPDNPDDPGGGGDNSGGSVDLSGVESGIQNIEDLINGEPIDHDTALGEGIDGLDSYENALLDDAGADTALDAFGDLVDDFDLMEDTPNADTGLWINTLVNPLFTIFGIFIVFPLLIGVVGALLGRRYTL